MLFLPGRLEDDSSVFSVSSFAFEKIENFRNFAFSSFCLTPSTRSKLFDFFSLSDLTRLAFAAAAVVNFNKTLLAAFAQISALVF